MKQKYLLSMLVGGAMLTACSVDDDLSPVKVAQDVNPSAPVFSVSFDNEDDALTRATYGDNKVSFEENKDLLSLYHGVSDAASFTNYQNAIYKGKFVEGAEGTKMDFTTQSFIMKGYAVMMYPADTTYAWTAWSGAPVVKVPAVQVDTTKLYTPYFSEILKIEDFKGDGKNPDVEAGYGRNYDVNLRRAAGVLDITLKKINENRKEGMPEIRFRKVEFNTQSSTNKFTTAVAIKAGEDAVAKKAHPIWAKASDLDLDNIIESSAKISTTDINLNTNVATFTLLPVKDMPAKDADDWFAEGKVVVYTNYGKVVIDANSMTDEEGLSEEELAAEKVWSPVGAPAGNEMTTRDAIGTIMRSIYTKSTSDDYKGENVGKRVAVELTVDMSKLDMNGMHIDNEDDLRDVLTVYQILNENADEPADVTFILDGDEKTHEFQMGEDTWALVAEQLAKEGNKVKIAPCQETGELCNKIVLTRKTQTNVPVLKLSAYKTDEGVQRWPKAAILLSGKGWTYEHAEEVKLGRVTGLNVLEGAELTLVGTTEGNIVKATVDTMSGVNFAINVDKGGEIVVDKVVRLETPLNNHGTVTIANAGDRLRVAGGVTLTNFEAQGENVDGWTEGGIIDNSGTLTIVEGSGATIKNYGVINIKNEDAVTLITTNGEGTGITAKFSSSNRLGTINLLSKDAGNGNLTIKEVTSPAKKNSTVAQGFVKFSKKQGASSSYANYVILDDGKNWTADYSYVEIPKTNTTRVEVSTTATVNALIMNIGTDLFIKNSTTKLTTDYLYLKGFITRAGTLTVNGSDNSGWTGYYGGDYDTDHNNVDSFTGE